MTFNEACYAHGLSDDDQEYADAIIEASFWSFGHSMRKLFVTLLTSNSITIPYTMWDDVWQHLDEDLQHSQRILLNLPGILYFLQYEN